MVKVRSVIEIDIEMSVTIREDRFHHNMQCKLAGHEALRFLEAAQRARSAAESSSPSAENKPEVTDDVMHGLQVQSIFLLAATWLLDHKALKV